MNLDKKIDYSIALLRKAESMALRLDPENGFYLAFSGGKDIKLFKVTAMKKEDIEKAAAIYTAQAEDSDYAEVRDVKRAFADGANWCINSVWHDASEQPKRNEIYLVQMGKDGFDTFYDSKNWKVFKRGLNITRWAYIEDLLPNTEE